MGEATKNRTKKIYTFKGHTSAVYSVSFSHHGRFVLTGGHDETAILWDLKSKKKVIVYKDSKKI